MIALWSQRFKKSLIKNLKSTLLKPCEESEKGTWSRHLGKSSLMIVLQSQRFKKNLIKNLKSTLSKLCKESFIRVPYNDTLIKDFQW